MPCPSHSNPYHLMSKKELEKINRNIIFKLLLYNYYRSRILILPSISKCLYTCMYIRNSSGKSCKGRENVINTRIAQYLICFKWKYVLHKVSLITLCRTRANNFPSNGFHLHSLWSCVSSIFWYTGLAYIRH